MKTGIEHLLDVEFPIFAFSHCRDVVAAVTNAGGVGVLGAVAHTPDELEVDLCWLDEHTGGRPYGVDLLMPREFAGAKEGGLDRASLRDLIPDEHRAFLDDMLARHGVPDLPRRAPSDPPQPKKAGLQVDPKSMAPLIDIAFAHRPRLIASALGTPPAWLIEKARAKSIPVAALAGTVEHAVAHAEAGVDLVVAQGSEAGGHTGEITTMVLVPQVVDAVAPVPVLAAGGIGDGRQIAASLALGAAGVWCGSIWQLTEEADNTPAEMARFIEATSADTVRSRSFTGKPCRVLRSDWTAEWDAPGAPKPLAMPLQSMLVSRSRRRIERAAHDAGSPGYPMLSPFVGQVVGMMNAQKPSRRVVLDMVEQMIEAFDRIDRIAGS